MKRYKTDKGISFLVVIGSYGGFHFTNTKHSIHVCLGWIAFTIFYYDVENALAQTLLKDKEKQYAIHGVIKRIEEYAPEPVNYKPFDETKKADYIYCVEWGMKKAKRNEFEVYQKMLKELKEKYVL